MTNELFDAPSILLADMALSSVENGFRASLIRGSLVAATQQALTPLVVASGGRAHTKASGRYVFMLV